MNYFRFDCLSTIYTILCCLIKLTVTFNLPTISLDSTPDIDIDLGLIFGEMPDNAILLMA